MAIQYGLELGKENETKLRKESCRNAGNRPKSETEQHKTHSIQLRMKIAKIEMEVDGKKSRNNKRKNQSQQTRFDIVGLEEGKTDEERRLLF